ncbi:MAG: FxLYD domain-containing protein [Synergistaceae bacterium]|nr:FxLYD domain-containing protein [Synergistaceae bacterium]
MKKTVAAGILFGAGFLIGFLSGYKYASENIVCEVPPMFSGVEKISSQDVTSPYLGMAAETEISGDAPTVPEIADIGLSVQEHWMDSDDHGLYIAGTVRNYGVNSFDAVRVAFDLCDAEGRIYTAVTARNDERIEPGESWDFTAYIPYSDMDKFNSYRLQSIMGVKR